MSVKQYFFRHPRRLGWLIAGSLLLLGISQALWLKKVWNEQRDALEQEVNFMFQKTMIQLQDSLVQRAFAKNGKEIALHSTTLQRRMLPPPVLPLLHPEGDTIIRIGKGIQQTEVRRAGNATKQLKVIFSTGDSMQQPSSKGLGRVLLKIKSDTLLQTDTDLVIELQTDTVLPQEMRRSFATALAEAGINLDFNVEESDVPLAGQAPMLRTESLPAGLLNHRFYTANFERYQPYLLKKIIPSALFSLLLLTVVGFAFFLIFKNLQEHRRLAEQKNEFISNVTHELKTPLTTVGVALEALKDFNVWRDAGKTREYLHIAQLELDRLNLMVEKVLRLSMFEQDVLRLRSEAIDFAAVVRQVVDAMSLQAAQIGAEIRLHIPETVAYWTQGDRLHLTGVVYNLLDNALKYRRGKPAVDVSLQVAQGLLRLEVRDNGLGIAPAYQQQVFEKFFRVPAGDRHDIKGHGLGLSYIAQVLERHGGTIHLESREGEGSVFTVEIPAATPPPID